MTTRQSRCLFPEHGGDISSMLGDRLKGMALPDLITQASAVLAREASRLVEPVLGTCTAHPPLVAVPGLSVAPRSPTAPPPLIASAEHPLWPGAVPGRMGVDRVRQQAYELIDSLLVTFRDSTGDQGMPAEDRVPHLSCAGPVRAGSIASATLRVANEESSPSELSLYCTNFVGDLGYEVPASRVTFAPRAVIIPSRAEASIEIEVDVPQQTPRGLYSGLVQATGTKYVKAVLTVQVL